MWRGFFSLRAAKHRQCKTYSCALAAVISPPRKGFLIPVLIAGRQDNTNMVRKVHLRKNSAATFMLALSICAPQRRAPAPQTSSSARPPCTASPSCGSATRTPTVPTAQTRLIAVSCGGKTHLSITQAPSTSS